MGTVMKVIADGDRAWPELREATRDGRVIHLGHGSPPIQIAALEGGMVSGEPSITIRLDLPDGQVVLGRNQPGPVCLRSRPPPRPLPAPSSRPMKINLLRKRAALMDDVLRGWSAYNDGRVKTWRERRLWRIWRWWHWRIAFGPGTHGASWGPVSMQWWPEFGVWVPAVGTKRWNE